MKKTSLGLFLLLSFLLVSCEQTAPVTLDTSSDTFSHLFVASEDQGPIKLEFYDIAKNVQDASYTVTLPDPRAPSRFETGNNDSVQYDPSSGEFLFATNGTSEMGGGCVNADGTCNGRLYEWKVGDDAPSLFWDSKGDITGWIIDPKTHTVWVNALTDIFGLDADGKRPPLLIHFDLSSGAILDHYAFSAAGPLQVSDGIVRMPMGLSAESGGLGFSILNPQSNPPLSTIELTANGPDAYLSGLAPDGKYYASLTPLQLTPMEQDVAGKLLNFDGEVSNFNIYWSGDSTHFMVQTSDGFMLYDLTSANGTSLGEAGEGIVLWAPSTRYLLTWKDSKYLLHDLTQKTATPIDFSFAKGFGVLGATFY